MKNSKYKVINQSKTVYLVLLVLILISFNRVLHNELEDKHRVAGQLLAQQIYQLTQQPAKDSKDVLAQLKRQGFMLVPGTPPSYLRSIISIEQQVVNFNALTVELFYWPMWLLHGRLFLWLNLIILAAAGFGYRYWQKLNGLPTISPQQSAAYLNDDIQQDAAIINAEHNNGLYSLYNVTSSCYSLFALIEYNCHVADSHTQEINFKVPIAKRFTELNGVSVRLLSEQNLAVTLTDIPVTELECYVERLHRTIFKICQNSQPQLTEKHIKMGVCNYRLGADQVKVYQLAKSALVLSQRSMLQHCHRLPLNHSQMHTKTNKQVIESIKKNQFVIFFQPLFALRAGEILQHEALIKIRGDINEPLLIEHDVSQKYSKRDAFLFDKTIILQVKKLLLSEAAPAIVSINLRPKNWSNKKFWDWLSAQMGGLNEGRRLQFEINEADFYKQQGSLTEVLKMLAILDCQIILGNVKNSNNIIRLAHQRQVSGLKLAYGLVHAIDKSAHQQSNLQSIVSASKLLRLPVYAVGVETEQELQVLTQLGVHAAQGVYFSQLLPDITQTVFH